MVVQLNETGWHQEWVVAFSFLHHRYQHFFYFVFEIEFFLVACAFESAGRWRWLVLERESDNSLLMPASFVKLYDHTDMADMLFHMLVYLKDFFQIK